MKIQTTNSLMKYLRNTHNMKIQGSKDKRNLINIGYYHGYKGYRYINSPNKKITITDFNEIVSIVKFDSKLKGLFYPELMQIETIAKNIVLQILVEKYKTDEFNVIYEKGMIDYKNSTSKTYKNKMRHRMKVRNDIYNILSTSYNKNNKIVEHFYSKDRHVPIWGIFELIMLGTFADLIKSLELSTRQEIDKMMGINISQDTNAKFPEKIIYLIKDLRNSVAHNDAIFDVRFKRNNIDTNLCNYLEQELNCKNITFNTITDYILLIAFLMKKFEINKKEINNFINQYELTVDEFRNQIPINIFMKIIYTDNNTKIQNLKKFLKK